MKPGAGEVIDMLRAAAVHHTVEACLQAHPELNDRFGARGRQSCIEDIEFHLDFLRSAVETGEPSLFVSYVGWLAQVLDTRGVPLESLDQSLVALAAFFREQTDADGDAIVAVLDAGREALKAGAAPPNYLGPSPEPWPEVVAFSDHALAGDSRAAGKVFEDVLARSGSAEQTAVHLLQPAMYRIGQLWQENKVTVAQEHLAAALVQTLMAKAYGQARPGQPNGRKALFACGPGNRHTIGLRMVADSFELSGWEVYYLGADTPIDALVAQARQVRPDLVGLSASLPFHLKSVRETVARLRSEFGDDCPRIVVGGLIVNQFPPLAAHLGAELLATDAIAAAESAGSAHAA